MKDSFILYTDQRTVIEKLTDEQAGKLIKAIYQYTEEGTMPELDTLLEIAIIPIKQNIDKNNEKWEEERQKRSEAGRLGGLKKAKNQQSTSSTKQSQAELSNAKECLANQAVYVNDNVNVNDNEKIYTLSEAKASTSGTAKASKHKHGQFKNVLLKDEELQALQRDFANWEELIEFLSEYIEMKGYKAKSHYLCIRKWVVEAVKERKPKQATRATNLYQMSENQCEDFSKFYI